MENNRGLELVTSFCLGYKTCSEKFKVYKKYQIALDVVLNRRVRTNNLQLHLQRRPLNCKVSVKYLLS